MSSVDSSSLSYIDFLLPGILALSIMISAVIGLSTIMVDWRQRGILRRLKLTPIPLAEFFAARQEVTKTYARRAVRQMLLMLKAHADSQHDPDFGRLLPDGRSYRVVPTEPVDAA